MGFGRVSGRISAFSIWMAHGALGRARCTAHPQAAAAGDGARGTRPSPHPGGPYADALRRAISPPSARRIGRRSGFKPEGAGPSRRDGNAGHRSTWRQPPPPKADCRTTWGGCRQNDLPLRALPPCGFDGLYIAALRSNPRTLSAPLWRIGILRDFRTESVSQAIATSRGGEGERIQRRTEGPARFPHWRCAFSSTASRTQRDIRLDTARLHGSEHRSLRKPFSPIRTKRGA